ncbi:MAG: ATP synthase F1 subunit delta [Cytophagaceae bacterium]
MHESRVAAPYAKSLLVLAKEQGVLEDVQKDMEGFVAVCENNKQLVRILKNPIVGHDKKLAILKSLFGGKVNKLTMSMFEIITRKNREAYLFEITKEFIKQYRIVKGIESAVVTTAVPLTDDQRKSFVNLVSGVSGKKVNLTEVVNEEIIGGFVLRVGQDRQVDESIKTKLSRIRNKFKDNPFISKY